MFTFTPAAIEKVKALRAHEQRLDLALRVFLAPGGCHGLSYGLTWETAKKEKDLQLEVDGVRVLLDPLTGYLLRNARVDYHDSLMQSGFDFINPDAKSTCACGTSFASEEVPGEPGNCGTGPSRVH
ncbi:MAG: iron-sulfur cluster assembly accessory protein [Chloroflexi bacterium]|nr:iron-sulfur cluster assembly accessory protein [Chloroflexota bacterium]